MPFDDAGYLKQPEQKADPFSLESLIAWLEKQPAGRTYNFWDGTLMGNCHGACLLHQYLVAQGLPKILYPQIASIKKLEWDKELQHFVASPTPQTFGAALDRARALASRKSAS